jgi:hypothetical protein
MRGAHCQPKVLSTPHGCGEQRTREGATDQRGPHGRVRGRGLLGREWEKEVGPQNGWAQAEKLFLSFSFFDIYFKFLFQIQFKPSLNSKVQIYA